MDSEDCEEFTDVFFWLKFRLISNARQGIGFRSHNAPEFESLSDTKDKLETRRKDVLSRSNRRIFLFLTYCNNNKVCVSSVDYYQLKKLST
ncbi:hypothetical protein Bca4012_033364 [Brassica carinata]